jgi:hypothetical protein
MVLALTIWVLLPKAVPSPEATSLSISAAPSTVSIPGVAPVWRQQVSPFVRLVAAADWDGRVEVIGRSTEIDLRRGFVAVSFLGGRGRALRLRGGAVDVEVVGTRFLVERLADNVFVAVAEGTVRLRVGGATHLVRAGEQRELGANQTLPVAGGVRPSQAVLADPYLTAFAEPERPARPPRPRPTLTGEDVTLQLARAEELVDIDQIAAAETIYEACVDDTDDAYNPFRALCRLHLARLYGFFRGRSTEARALLQELAQTAGGEVGREAALAECELDLKSDPCRTKSCLLRLTQRSGDEPELGREAGRLLDRWSLSERKCE